MTKIVIVEDDPAILDTFRIILDREYEVQLHMSAEMLMQHKFDLPDLFIIDKQLSGTSGTTLCGYLKSNVETSQIPVILISASPDIYHVAEQAGADAALEKPFRVKDLRALIGRVLSRP